MVGVVGVNLDLGFRVGGSGFRFWSLGELGAQVLVVSG